MRIIQIILICVFLINFSCDTHEQSQLSKAQFSNPPDEVKMHTWWHWLDGNITKEGITRDLEAMKQQGIVQATILNIGLFGEKDFGMEKVDFNSQKWYDMFQWSLEEANRLGISIGAHNCDGWSTSGGPWITPESSMKKFIWTKTILNSSQQGIVKLKQPVSNLNFYNDVAVIAIRSDNPLNSFQNASPEVILKDVNYSEYLDGCPSSAFRISLGDKITFRFREAFSAEKITIMPQVVFLWANPADYTSTYSISASDDGKTYKKIKEFTINGLNSMVSVPFEITTAKYFQLSLVESNRLDGYIPLTIAECEFLKNNENPLYSSEIEYLSEKTGSVKTVNEAVFYSPLRSSVNTEKEVIDITSKMNSDGTLNWKPDNGNWTVIRFGYTTTGARNGPATEFGRGLECDKMDTAALNLHFNSFPAKLIEKAGEYAGNTFKFMLIDSWECGFQNWTSGMLKEFEERRGYSLTSFIPVLCGESSGNAKVDEAVLFDFRKTIAELIENNYYKHFGELLNKNNIEFHAEVIYGNASYPPLDILKTTQYVDLPMFEFWTSTDDERVLEYHPASGIELNMPSCAATGYEKPVMASEAYTGMAHYSESPAGLKPFGDRAYCAGINQMILHSYVHQPNDLKPGMTLGQFGSHFNRNNNYWPFISEWINYQSRIQYILQQGVASHDILYYLGDQLPQFLINNKSNTLPFGYQFNSCNFDILKNRIKVEDGKLVLNGKVSYSVLCLPPFESMNFETLKLIEEVVNEGVILYGPKPLNMLSLSDVKNNQKDFDELSSRIWGGINVNSVTSNNYGKGKVYWGLPLSEVLKNENIIPDIYTHYDDTTNLMFTHKKVGDEDVYFIMNQQNHELTREISFRIKGKSPEIWDPIYGTITVPEGISFDELTTTIPVTLMPYQSLFFVFKKKTRSGKSVAQKKITEDLEFIISDFNCKINFTPGYQSEIEPLETKELQWLSESENPDIKYFSGIAKYVISFSYPIDEIESGDSLLLDLGKFGSIAEINLNGSSLGKVWYTGTLVPLHDKLKKENILEVSVANIYRNRFIGDYVQYGKIQNIWTSSPISDFLNKDLSLQPSGLKGPLRIVRVRQ